MLLFIFLLFTEVLTLIGLFQHFYRNSKPLYFLFTGLHVILSIWIWYLFVKVEVYTGNFDTSQNIWLRMNLTGLISAVVVPRIIFDLFHFIGKLIKLKSNSHVRSLSNVGLILSVSFMLIVAAGTFVGRFNFKTEEVILTIDGLDNNLDGFRIVLISDIHLPGFHNHTHLLKKVMDDVNIHNPDLVINTGDFISYGWREFGRNDTIFNIAKGKYGNFAVLGNHDIGTYHPTFSETDIMNNISKMNQLISASGYNVLNDENIILNIKGETVALIGVVTSGQHPEIIHGDVQEAMAGTDKAGLKILLSHDPNHWEKDIIGKTDIDITLSGHTHGMQMGILTKNFKWSPSKYFYPHWNGLYTSGKQYLYVNRGLGLLVIPFRIWMPPEITLIILKPE